MSFVDQALPALSNSLVPPIVRGTADLTEHAYQGDGFDALMERIDRCRACNPPAALEAAQIYDEAIAAQLAFRRAEGLNLQDAALAMSRLYRVGGPPDGALRLLALVGPGDLMTNTPLDFLTNHLHVRLDLLYVEPDRALPAVIPDHDVAFFALCEPDPGTLARLRRLYATWPRPVVNDPVFLPAAERDVLSRSLAGVAGLCSPTAVAVSRIALDEHLRFGRPIGGFPGAPYPCLIRPMHSHAGSGLAQSPDRVRTDSVSGVVLRAALLSDRVRGLSRARRAVSKVPRRFCRPTAVSLPSGDFQQLDGALSQRGHDQVGGEAGRGSQRDGRLR